MRSVALFALSAALQAQTFEVASIKTAPPGPGTGVSMGIHLYPGRTNIYNMTLHDLVASAWSIDQVRISGGLAWTTNDRYTIDATFPQGSNRDQMPVMLRALLLERFRLKLRHESRETGVYDLMPAKKGLKLTPTREKSGNKRSIGRVHLQLSNVTIADLAEILTGRAERQVIDKTGIEGKYDFTVDWGADDTGPSLFTVLEEQYGLKLVASRAPVDYLVIEGAEKPTDN